METKQGIIKSVSNKSGITKAGKPYKNYVFEMMDGKSYSTFDEKIGTSFKAGDNVDIDGEQNGDYWNMKAMHIAQNTNNLPVVALNEPISLHDRERTIIAQCLTKCFSEIISLNPGISVENTMQRIRDAYRYFLKEQ